MSETPPADGPPPDEDRSGGGGVPAQDAPSGSGGASREDDPLAFAPDERDGAPAADPLAFPPDARDAGAPEPAAAARGPRAPDRGGERPRPAVSPPGGRYVLLAAVLLAVVAGVSILALHRGGGGDGQVRPGERLPPFAAPLATMPKLAHDDVNLAARPDQGPAGRRPACAIDHPSVVTSCALLRRGPLVLMLFSRRVGECVRAVDELDRLGARRPRLQTLAVAIVGHHDDTTAVVRARGWRLPVAYDADGALSSRLGAAVCPLVLFVRPDGVVQDRIVGRVTPAALEQKADELLAAPPGRTRTGPSAPRP